MIAMVEKMARDDATREKLRRETAVEARAPQSVVFNFRPPSKAFRLHLSFSKSQVAREEIIGALESILADLRANS